MKRETVYCGLSYVVSHHPPNKDRIKCIIKLDSVFVEGREHVLFILDSLLALEQCLAHSKRCMRVTIFTSRKGARGKESLGSRRFGGSDKLMVLKKHQSTTERYKTK